MCVCVGDLDANVSASLIADIDRINKKRGMKYDYRVCLLDGSK